CHVLVSVPSQSVRSITSSYVTGTSLSQISVAVTVRAGSKFSHSAVAVADGKPTNTGATASVTVITCSNVTSFPHASSAVHVLVIVPQPSVTSITSSYVTGTSLSQLSVAKSTGMTSRFVKT